MGSSISSVIAQIVLEELESQILPKLTYEIPFFYRYVDDCIVAIPKNQKEDIIDKFNSFHPKLRFTLEIEENSQINFLDMTLFNCNNQIKTQWYTKKTWSGRYLNYFSQHPFSQKKSVIIGLADRAIALSDIEHRNNAIQKAKDILQKNNYPTKLINSIFTSRLNKLNSPTNNNRNKEKSENYLSLPYIQGLSENLQKNFNKHNIKICHKGYNLLKKNFSNLKSKTPIHKKTHTIYEIPCAQCPSVYIGQSSQYLCNRINGHKYDKKNKTALTNHEIEKKHKFDFNKVKILKTEPQQAKREFLEMIYIKKMKIVLITKLISKI